MLIIHMKQITIALGLASNSRKKTCNGPTALVTGNSEMVDEK